jgi:hypothetical protein
MYLKSSASDELVDMQRTLELIPFKATTKKFNQIL